jgi:biopolymer transport protein TolR
MKRRMGKPKLMAEINITPFTDVVLVLLIIFMIATPFIYQSGIKVELPQGSTSEEISKDIIITINDRGEVFLEDCDPESQLSQNSVSQLSRIRYKEGERGAILCEIERDGC